MQDYTSIINALKSDLAVRHDNIHAGSGLGGDFSQLYFLMSKNIELLSSKKEIPCMTNNGHSLKIEVPSRWFKDYFYKDESNKVKPELITDLRVALRSVFDEKKDITVTQDQFVSWGWWAAHERKTTDISLMISALKVGFELSEILADKLIVLSELDKMFSKERKTIEESFLKEMKLPTTSFDKELDKSDDNYYDEQTILEKMLTNHPIWGQKIVNINKRQSKMFKNLLSEDNMILIQTINSLPFYLKVITYRNCVGIETIVRFNLDEIKGMAEDSDFS